MRDTRLMRRDPQILPRLADHHTRGPDGGWHKAQWGTVLGGEGGMVSTLEDMKVWLANLDAPKVGTPEMIARMSAPGAVIDGIPSPYGLGLVTCRYRGLASIGHGGGVAGGRSESVRFPEAGIGIVILGNTDDMGPFSLARRILDVVQGEEVGPPRTARATERLKRAVGLYRAEGGDDVFGVAVKDGQPVFVSNGNGGMPIEQVGDGAFVPERGIAPLEFTPRDDGDMDTSWFGRPRRFRRPVRHRPAGSRRPGRPLRRRRHRLRGRDRQGGGRDRAAPAHAPWRVGDGAGGPRPGPASGAAARVLADTPAPAIEAGGWEFTVRLVADGIVLNNDRTKHLLLARAT